MGNIWSFAEGAMTPKVFFRTVLIILLSSFCTAAFFKDSPVYQSPPGNYREGYILVRFYETGTTANAIAARTAVVQAAGGGTIEKMYPMVPGLALVKLPSGASVEAARYAFQATPGVQYAVQDHYGVFTAIPNDPLFGQLWGMHNTGQTGGTPDADIDAPEAWNLFTGNKQIIVGVVDSGVNYTHPDLAANIWVNTAELNGLPGVDDDGNGYIDDVYGYDFVNQDSEPEDTVGHGTHVAGTIGAVGNNRTGVVGVNWNVRIMPLKIGDVYVSSSAAIEAIQYALNKGVKVLNHSWGGPGYNQALYDAIAASGKAGMLHVAAAGNDQTDNDLMPFYPASYNLPNIIAVLATDHNDQKASFSHWGKTSVDLGAPGVNIHSTVPIDLDNDGNPNGYQSNDGTSMASPHVAGACALVWSAAPTLTAAEVKQVILGSVDKLNSLKNLCVSEGRLNLFKALSSIKTQDTIPPIPNPPQWSIPPQATGLRHIVMEAETAIDASGVEYSFECIDNDALNSGWQTEPLYILGDQPAERDLIEPGRTYTFRFKVRDRSENHNETEYSELAETTTASGTDTLPPAPNPSRWKAAPRPIGNSRIGMELVESYDENGVEYYFDCVSFSDGNADDYDSQWQDNPYYITPIVPTGVAGKEFIFVAYVRQKGQTDPQYRTEPAPSQKSGYTTSRMTRQVPSAAYPTIKSAVDAANAGDTVLVHPGVYRETNIVVDGKAITIRSINPQNPSVAASTIIDCEDIWDFWQNEHRRAFLFQNVDRNTILAGFTIRNATAIDDPSLSGDPDGRDALGGAIFIGQDGSPASPSIQNCIFENCSALGQYGSNGINAPSARQGSPGLPGGRGGDGGNAYGGAIYCVTGSAPMIKACQFTNCYAVGGWAGNGGNGSNAGEVPDAVEEAFGYKGGDGGDAGKGGCAWGGAIYFEPGCKPDLQQVVISDCYIQVGEAGRGGNGADGGKGKGEGSRGGHGGNGGMGGDLRAPDSSGGAIYFGDHTEAAIEDCQFTNCRVVVQLHGDYSGGDGGNGGEGVQAPRGNGGHGGPAFFIPDKLYELGLVTDAAGTVITEGVRATGGTGGAGDIGGYGGFRRGQGGPNGYPGFSGHTGIWPSNLYYMAYYWEDTGNVDNQYTHTDNIDDYLLDTRIPWEWDPVIELPPIPMPPAEPGVTTGDMEVKTIQAFYSRYYPFYGLIEQVEYFTVTLGATDPDNPEDPAGWTWDLTSAEPKGDVETTLLKQWSSTDPDKSNGGACAGANFYGVDSRITMKDTTVSFNRSFANHGGGELYDKGCRATFENCTYQGNSVSAAVEYLTDYRLEGFGGGIFADQPENFVLTNCQFLDNDAYSGAGLYCNFAPSGELADPNLILNGCTFSGNTADYHFGYSYSGGVYAGNSFDPYEEFYFNNFNNTFDFRNSEYIDHGEVNFYYVLKTDLWDNIRELDHILLGDKNPAYNVTITGSVFEENKAAYGAGLHIDASAVTMDESEFLANTALTGAGGFFYACDLAVKECLFQANMGEEITSRGILSEQENSAAQGIAVGAGLYISDSDVFLTASRFLANESNAYAGALGIIGPPLDWSEPQWILNNLFVQNTAGIGGGAIQAEWASDVSITNCTFVDNKTEDTLFGSGGAVMAHDTFVDITNSIFRGNQAALGSQICVGDPYETFAIPYTTVFVDYSNVQGGEDEIYVTAGIEPWLWYGDSNLDTDPILLDFGSPQRPETRTFYLSHTVVGQAQDSPCIDAGYGMASFLTSYVGFPVTTRTDFEPDSGTVDMGYHYNADPINRKYFTFQANVIKTGLDDMGEIEAEWTVSGLTQTSGPALSLPPVSVIQGTVIRLKAVPNDPAIYRVKKWSGTDNDLSTSLTNVVTMMGDRTVTVEFELALPKYITVPSQVETLAEAVALARDNDTIVLAPRPGHPYFVDFVDTDNDGIGEGIDLLGKSITITSEDPNDPLVVASTIIDCGGTRYAPSRGFVFRSGEGRDTVIQGLTIQNGFLAGALGLNAAVINPPYPPIDQTPPPPNQANSGEDAIGDGYGGAILCENGSSPTILNCIFKNCVVTGGYGGDGANGRPAVEDAEAPGEDGQSGGHGGSGYGMGYGGAIACLDGSSPVIKNCLFDGNMAMGGCGGRGGSGSNGEGNGKGSWGGNGGNANGNGSGGAVYVEAGCKPMIKNCIFKNNTAQHGTPGTGGFSGTGSAYNDPWDRFWPGLNGSIQVYAHQPIDGGAIKFGGKTQNTLENCTFKNNRAFEDSFENSIENFMDVYITVLQRLYTNGGGVSVGGGLGGKITLRECRFEENMGGAVWCGEYVAVEIDNSEFKSNGNYDKVPGVNYYEDYDAYLQLVLDPFQPTIPMESFGEAGAITISKHAPSAIVKKSRFYGNFTLGRGGAIRSDSDLTLDDCTFGNNESSRGGAVDLYYEPNQTGPRQTLVMNITDCTFSGNSAYLTGGGLFVRNGQITANDSSFIDNTARSGGGFYLTEGQMKVDRSFFMHNVATGIERGHQTVTGEGQGGAVACMNAKAQIRHTRFIENKAKGGTGEGGAVNFTNLLPHTIEKTYTIKNCLFERNLAQKAGGAIAAKVGSSPTIEFCTFLDNESPETGGAIYLGPAGVASISHSIITGSLGMAFYEAAPVDSNITSCLFYANLGGNYTSILPAGTLQSNPMLEAGKLGNGYLNQAVSPAVNAGSVSAVSAELEQFTTDPFDTQADTGMADLGYHYPFASGLATYTLKASVENGKGTVSMDPDTGPYYNGQIVTLSAQISSGYLITGWSGTLDDSSTESINRVFIDGDKEVVVHVRLPKTIYVGGSTGYNSLYEALSGAKDGDIIIANPGLYQSTSSTGLDRETLLIMSGKNLTIRGSNPDDPETVQNTIFDRHGFILLGLGSKSKIEGVTFRRSKMELIRSNPVIRNCRFINCNWYGGTDRTPEGCAQDGVYGGWVEGGAVGMKESSPTFIGCLFEGNSATGGDGTDAQNGCDGHPDGGDGGWPGWAYGGAVSCQFSSHPVFENCTFRDNFVQGGTGGRGGDGNGPPNEGYGGLGGGWNFSDQIEIDHLIRRGWDGWQRGRKYEDLMPYYEMYDWDLFAKWFEFNTDRYQSWNDLQTYYQFDPYDSFLSYWRYGGYGGAVFCAYDSSVKFNGCVFEGNNSSSGLTGVGGESAYAGDVSEPDRELNIPNAGGAVYAMFDCDLEFNDCILSGNTASINVAEFPHTIHVGFGGAVAYEYDCTARFSNCVFTENLASDGGAIYANESFTTIQDCNVADNTAYLGAGLYQLQNQADIENVKFRRNQATSPNFEPPVEITYLGQGGGMFAGGAGLTMTDSIFVDNAADFSGGGLFSVGENPISSKIHNCLFAQNRSGRDGGGASIYWRAELSVSNCTFADNYVSGRPGFMTGSGGGLYIGYNSTVQVIDSIFWLNYALQGAQATVGSGFDDDPYPSVLNLSYSDVLNISSSENAVYARAPNKVNKLAGILDVNPLFEGPIGTDRIILPEEYYYLNPSSRCIDNGSDLARKVGLDGYTTQLSGSLDRDRVDLGFHYFVVRRSDCAKIDNALVLSGMIDLADLTKLIVGQWLNSNCNAPGWCNGSDLNYDKTVDLWDLAMLSSCWLESDQTPPVPDPMQWAERPAVLPTTLVVNNETAPNPNYRIDRVSMAAVLAHDGWWPDSSVSYRFHCVSHPQMTTPPVWQSGPAKMMDGLYPGETYEFIVYAKDGSGNITQPSPIASVRAGTNYDKLLPDPSQFEIAPGGVGSDRIGMVAEQVTGLPAVPAPLAGKGTFHIEYCFLRTDESGETINLPAGTNPRIQQNYDNIPPYDRGAVYSSTPWQFVDTGLTLGETYYYRVFTQLIFRETGSGKTYVVMETQPSAVYAASTVEADTTPPTPSPAQWEVWPSHLQYDVWYHYMRAVEADDDSGVEYRFVCVTFPSLSSGWQNEDNVVGVIDPDGTERLPNEYWAPVYVSSAYYDYYILVRDRSPNQNQTAPSRTCTAGQNAGNCPNYPIAPAP